MTVTKSKTDNIFLSGADQMGKQIVTFVSAVRHDDGWTIKREVVNHEIEGITLMALAVSFHHIL